MLVSLKGVRSYEINRGITRSKYNVGGAALVRDMPSKRPTLASVHPFRFARAVLAGHENAQASQMSATQIKSLSLWWLRRDLRTADNEALMGACSQSDALLPMYCFDPRDVESRRATPEGLGVPKLGPHRCRFLLEALVEVRREIRQLQKSAKDAAAAEAPARETTPGTAPAPASTAALRQCGGGAAVVGVEESVARQADEGLVSRCSGGGGGLVIRFGRPEMVIPELLSRILEWSPQLRHVALHHHLDVLDESEALERDVARALSEWGHRQGVSISVHTYWDRTLYHPDDLPYHMFDKASKAAARHEVPSNPGRRRSGATAMPSQQSPSDGRLQPWHLPMNADRSRYRNLPPVMTDFRKVTQAAAAVRPSLPAPTTLPPLPPPFNYPSAAAAANSLTAVPADEPAAGAPAAAHVGQLGDIPRTVGEVYDAAGAQGALQRLEELVELNYRQLLPPVHEGGGSTTPDPRTAFPFRAGHDNAVRRLKYYVWGHIDGPSSWTHPRDNASGCSAGGGGCGTSGSSIVSQQSHQAPSNNLPPSLLYFTNTRAQASGVDNSTKLSPFVALGCITPRQIYEEVQRVKAAAAAAAATSTAAAGGTMESSRGAADSLGGLADAVEVGGESTGQVVVQGASVEERRDGGSSVGGAVPPPAECDWLAMHLCIRDFFIFTVLKEGAAVLDERGIMGQPVSWRRDLDLFTSWSRGLTGLPFVDANMRELAATGWMSNRGRQNVASLVTKDLGLDWRWGAELFECLLLDCDVAVNFCNWNYFAGIGNDPRNRHFKTVTQGMRYDEDAVLAATWLPALMSLPPALRHQPWTMTLTDAEQYGVVLGHDYPAPIVDPANQMGVLTGAKKPKSKTKNAKT